jgi:hypothetical protein
MNILLPLPRAEFSGSRILVAGMNLWYKEAKKALETLDPLWPLKGLDDHEVCQEKLCPLGRCGDQEIPLSLSKGAC